MEKSLKDIFADSKISTNKCQAVKDLMDIYSKNNFEKFCENFMKSLESALTDEEGNETVEFISTFLSSIKLIDQEFTGDKNTDGVALHIKILQFLLKNHEAENSTFRHKVCSLISTIFNSIHQQLHLDNPISIKIKKAMLHHLMDDVPTIRVQAILTLHHFQDPSKTDCEIICAFSLFLSIDPNPEVRKAILGHICVNPKTLPEILERRNDKQDTVRKQVYIIIAEHVNMRILSETHRISILDEGLKDRSPSVRGVVKKNLLPAWLKESNGNVVDFLKLLNIETWADRAGCAVKSLFEDLPASGLLSNFNLLNERKLIPYEKLTTESVFYWKCLAKYLRSEKTDNSDLPVNKVLPPLTSFCEYVTKYLEMTTSDVRKGESDTTKDFICQQLISMTTLFDLTDEVGHNDLCSLVRKLFLSPCITESCIRSLSIVFSHLYSPSVRLNKLSEIIYEIRHHSDIKKMPLLEEKDPIFQTKITQDLDLKLSQTRLKVKLMREDLEECVRSLNVEKAGLLKEALEKLEIKEMKIREDLNTQKEAPAVTSESRDSTSESRDSTKSELKLEHSDNIELFRSLLILSEFLSNTEVLEFDAGLRSLHDSLVLPSLQSQDVKVRKYAVRSLALCCLLSRALAKQHLSRLSQIVKFDEQENIRTEALQGLFEIWLLYGLEEFYPDGDSCTEDGDKEVPYVAIMHTYFNNILQSNDGMLRTVAVEGLCKLLLASQIKSFKLLSLLLLLWCSPSTENDTVLRELLEAFFTLYSKMGIFNQEVLAAALMPSLQDVISAPPHSPISKINFNSLVKFLITITSPAVSWNDAKMTSNAHDSLAEIICREILTNPNKPYTGALVSCLNHLNLTRTDHQRLQELSQSVQKIIEKLKNQDQILVQKFYQSIQSYLLQDKGERKNQIIVENNDSKNPSCSADTLLLNEAVPETPENSRPPKSDTMEEEPTENKTSIITNLMNTSDVKSENENSVKQANTKDKADSDKYKLSGRKKRGRRRSLVTKCKAKSPGVLGKNNTKEQLATLLQHLNKEKIQLPDMDIDLKATPWLRGLERKRKQSDASLSTQSKKRKVSKETSGLSVAEAVNMWKSRLSSVKIVRVFGGDGSSRISNWSTRLGRRRKVPCGPDKNNTKCESKMDLELSDMKVRNLNEMSFLDVRKSETKGRRRWSSTGCDTASKPTGSSLRLRATTTDSMSFSPATIPLLNLLSKSKDAPKTPEGLSPLAKDAVIRLRRESSSSSRARRERRSSCYSTKEESELPKHQSTRRYSVTVMYPNVLIEFTDDNI